MSFLPFLSSLVAILVVLPVAAAQTREAEPGWREEERHWSREVDREGFHVTSRRDSALGTDRIDVTFDLADATFAYAFSSSEPGNETRLAMELLLGPLVEFHDRDDDGRYGLGDEPVWSLPLSGAGDRVVDMEPLGTGGFMAVATFALRDPQADNASVDPIGGGARLVPGELRVTFWSSPQTRVLHGEPVVPTESVLEPQIERFPYRREDTLVALVTSLRPDPSSVPLETGTALRLRDGPFQLFHSWDGANDAARTTVLSGDETTIAHAWTRDGDAGRVLRFGAMRAAGGLDEVIAALVKGDPVVFTAAALVVLVAAGGPVWWRRREAR